ncbi:MAG: alpha-ketoglutarate-dependent dioxygenase AlkB [Saccharospirillum sp.]
MRTCETLLDDQSGCLQVYRNWWPNAEAWMQDCVENLPWEQSRVRVYGQEHPIPRLEAWLGEAGIRYGYSGQTRVMNGWPAHWLHLLETVNREAGCEFNFALANWYRNGADRMGWHADSEPELGVNPTVATLSLGAARDFRLRRNEQHKDTLTVSLASGDLVVMSGALQHHWQHSLPARAKAGDRISLTFRQIVS